MFEFLDDIVGFFGDAGDTASGFFDSLGSAGKTAASIFDSGDDIWGTITKIGGKFLTEGANLYAASQASEAAQKEGQSAAEVFYGNAKLYNDEAILIDGRTKDAATNARLTGIRLLSKQVVAYAKSGVTMEGSPLLVAHETSDLIEASIKSLIDTGQASSARQRSLAEIENKKAQNAIDAGDFKAEATIIGSAASSIERWTK